MALFNHLIAFFPSQSAVGNPIEPFPEAIISLSFETLKKFVSCRELGSKLKLNAYDTLGCFDGIRHCTISAYFEFIEKLLRSPISKEYTKYSSKILNIITTRIEKEYSNCIQDNQDSNMYVTECFRLIEGLLKIKGLLDEQYEAIETELAKIFLFINASKVDFTTEILKIGSGVVRAAGSHLSIMDPIVESFATVFERNDYELTDLYEVFYSYILKDSTFVLKEEQSMGKTSLNFVTGKPISSSNRASADKSKLTPFNAINQILLQVLNNACSDASRHHISTVLKALLLIILEMQIYNEGGLNDYFKMLLDSICSLLERIEKSFETLRDKNQDQTYILYIWSILALLNAYHYYYEEVASILVSKGFIQGFINKGAEIIASAYPSLPQFLQKQFQLSILRLIGSSETLNLDIESIAYLFKLISDLLSIEIASTSQEADAILGSHIKSLNYKRLKKTSKRGKDEGFKTNATSTSELVEEERLVTQVSVVPEHESKDFYVCSINHYLFLQRTFRELKEASAQFVDALKSRLSAEEQRQLNDVLSISVIPSTTTLINIDSKSHLLKEKSNNSMGVRKIARVARR